MLFPFSLMGEQLSAKDLSAEKAMNYDCFINSLLMALCGCVDCPVPSVRFSQTSYTAFVSWSRVNHNCNKSFYTGSFLGGGGLAVVAVIAAALFYWPSH